MCIQNIFIDLDFCSTYSCSFTLFLSWVDIELIGGTQGYRMRFGCVRVCISKEKKQSIENVHAIDTLPQMRRRPKESVHFNLQQANKNGLNYSLM